MTYIPIMEIYIADCTEMHAIISQFEWGDRHQPIRPARATNPPGQTQEQRDRRDRYVQLVLALREDYPDLRTLHPCAAKWLWDAAATSDVVDADGGTPDPLGAFHTNEATYFSPDGREVSMR